MVEAEKTGEKKTALDSFLEVDANTGNMTEGDVVRAALELAKPDYKPQLDTLKNLRAHAEAHRAKKQARVEELKVKYDTDQDLLNAYVKTEEKVLKELVDFIAGIDAKLVTPEASSEIDGRAGAILAEMKKKGEVTLGGEKAARYTALIVEGLRGDNNKLFAQAAEMMQEMFAQVGSGDEAKDIDKKREGRTTAEAVKLIKENLVAVKAAFGSRYTEQDIDNLAGFADGSNSPWLSPIKWIQQARGVDFKARLMKMADVAEKAAQEKDVAPVFAEIGMGDPDKLIPKYAEDIKARGIKGVPETYTDNSGDKHPLRDMLKAHLLVMVDLYLIKHEGWMDDPDAQAAQKKVVDSIGATHSDQLITYYRRRLKTITDAFPSVKLDGDETTSDKSRRKKVEKNDKTDDRNEVDLDKQKNEEDTVISINLEQAMVTLGLMEGKDDTKPEAELTRLMDGNMENTFNQNTFISLVEAVRTATPVEKKARVRAGLKTTIKPALVALGKTRAGRDVKTPTPFNKKVTEEGIKLFVSVMDTAS